MGNIAVFVSATATSSNDFDFRKVPSILFHSLAGVVTALCRLLFAIMPSSPPIIMTWAAIATYGMESAPYYLLVFLGIGYFLFVLPTRSSFRVVGKGRSKSLHPDMDELDELVMGRFESAVHSVSFVMLPVFFKYSIHHTHLVSSNDDIADILLLTSLPVLLIASLSTRGSLWWIGFTSNTISAIRKSLTTLAVLIIVGCLEVRVIFHSFSQYIKVSPPWDLVTVTSGIYLVTLIVLNHFAGVWEPVGMIYILTLLGGAAIACFCIALGVPVYMTPFGCAGSFFCARFYYYRRLQDYCSFVGTAALVIFWFIIRTFMFLDFEFDPLPMSLKHVCLVLMAVVLTSLLIPGMISVNKVELINGAILCLHATGMNVLELQLHCQFEGIYPIYLVIFTSTVGLYLAHYLFREGKVTRWTAWLMGSLYAGKLGLVLHPTPLALPCSLLLVFAISPIYVGVAVLKPKQAGQEKPLTRNAGMGFLVLVAAALFVTRHSVLSTLIKITIHHSPPESFLLGIVCILWTVACFGLFAYHFPQSAKLRRTFAVILCTGTTLVFIQPDMESLRAYSIIYTDSVVTRSGQTWPSWCLFGSVVAGLVLVGGSSSDHVSGGLQALLAAIGGFLAGLYLDGTFLPYSASLYSVSGLACSLAAQFVTLIPRAKAHGSWYVQAVFTAFVGLLPVAVMLQPSLLTSVAAFERAEALEEHRVGLVGLYVVLSVLIALTVKLHLQEPEAASSSSRPKPEGSLRLRAVAASSARGEWDWLPAAGNLATLLAYGLALTVSQVYLKSPDEIVVCLAPLLLLLSQDTGFFSALTDRQRYFPLVAASVVCLAGSALFRLLLREPLERHHWLPRSLGPHPEAGQPPARPRTQAAA